MPVDSGEPRMDSVSGVILAVDDNPLGMPGSGHQ